MSVYIRGQRFHRNIKQLLMFIYCDINTLEVVEHLRSHSRTRLHLVYLLNFSCALTPIVFISQHIQGRIQGGAGGDTPPSGQLFLPILKCFSLILRVAPPPLGWLCALHPPWTKSWIRPWYRHIRQFRIP
jgi:hypothetical protein